MTVEHTTQKLIELVKQAEGRRLKPYKDTEGYWTIGYGRCLDTTGISAAEAEMLLANDIAAAIEDVDYRLPWVKNLAPARRDVLYEMRLNLGMQGLLGFKNTLRFIEAHEYAKAADNMLKSKWATQVKGRANRLAEMMRSGEYPK